MVYPADACSQMLHIHCKSNMCSRFSGLSRQRLGHCKRCCQHSSMCQPRAEDPPVNANHMPLHHLPFGSPHAPCCLQTRYAFRQPIPHAPSVYSTPDPQGYEPVHLWLLSRHGSRWPTLDRMKQINSLNSLFKVIFWGWQRGCGH